MTYLPRVLRYLRPHWQLGVLSLVLLVLGGLSGLLAPWPMKVLIDNALAGLPLSGLAGRIVAPFAAQPMELLIFAVMVGFGFTVLQNGLSIANSYVNTRLNLNIVMDFRSALFEHAERLSLSYHDQARAGMIIYVINSQGDAVARLIMTVPQMGQSVVMLVGMFWISFRMDRQLALLSLSVVPFLYYSVGYYATHIKRNVLEVRAMEVESLSIVHEAISMFRVIMAFGREHYELGRFRRQTARSVDARVKLTVSQTLFSLLVNTATAGGTALVLGLGAYHVMQGRVTVGQLLVLLAYIAAVYKPLEAISATIGSLQEILVSLQSAFDLLDIEPAIKDRSGAIDLGRAQGRIAFEDVSFSYEGRHDTLSDVDFEAEPGQVVAVVGHTGAGKTTLVSLIPRFYAPSGGRILLDGIDIRDVTLSSLRSQISIVLQDPLLFSTSLADNIRYGRLNASMEEVIAAARAANAHDFIMDLPKHYETEIGERGAQLSTGERQRIAVARAFLKNAPVLVLDEPTSSIDSKTEAVILDALDRLMVGRTTFIIAHRLSTIRYADMILVLDHGRIVERGTHEQLMDLGGAYYQLHQIQIRRRDSMRIPMLTAAMTAAEPL